jgi:hypothetical protein
MQAGDRTLLVPHAQRPESYRAVQPPSTTIIAPLT